MGRLRQETRKLWRRLSGGWWDEHAGAGVAEELEFHRARRQEAFEQEGLSPIEARAASQRVMGNMTLAREEARATWRWTTLELFWGDLRYAVRSLRREKTFSVVAILTLATGICATTTIFSVVDSQIWRPLPFPDSERLVSISLTESGDATAREPAEIPGLPRVADGDGGIPGRRRLSLERAAHPPRSRTPRLRAGETRH